MSTTNNPVVNQPQRQITKDELIHFLTEVLQKTSEQFHPGKLAITGTNSDAIQLWLRENNATVLKVTKALLDAHNYLSAVKTLTTGYVEAVRAMMFQPNSKLEWTQEHPAVLKRRALEAQQRGEVQKLSNDQQQSAFQEKVQKAAADDAEAKQERKYELAVNDLIDRVFFVNPRTQTRDERKIQDLRIELQADVAKARKNGHSWGKIHAHVLTKRDRAYEQDERDRVKFNSR